MVGRYRQTLEQPILFSQDVGLNEGTKGLEVSIKGSVLFKNQENPRLLKTVREKRTQRTCSQSHSFYRENLRPKRGKDLVTVSWSATKRKIIF